MPATLVQLRDEVIIRADVRNHPQFPPTRINRIINHAQRYVQTQLNGLGMKKWETSAALSSLTGGYFGATQVVTKAVTTLTGMLESPASIMFIETTDGSTKGIAYPVDPDVFQEQIANTYLAPTIAKPVFTRLAGNIILAPNTITSGTAYYYKAITDLSGDSDVTEIPTEYEDFIIQKAVIEIESDLNRIQNKENKIQALEANLQTVWDKFNGKQLERNRSAMTNNAKLQ